MSNNKQDSIEFLWDELKPFLPANYTVDESLKILSILKQARAMHKEEQVNTFKHAQVLMIMDSSKRVEQYYNETFNQETK